MASASTSSLSLPNKKTHITGFPYSPTCKPFNPNLKLPFPFPPTNNKLPSVKSSSAVNYHVVVDEEMQRIRRLQNGSDVRGVALEGEKGRVVDLTPPAVEAIAESFGEWVVGKLGNERGQSGEDGVGVSLGKDPRISVAKLSVAVFAGLARAGCQVFDMGLATTPACFMSTLLPPFVYDCFHNGSVVALDVYIGLMALHNCSVLLNLGASN